MGMSIVPNMIEPVDEAPSAFASESSRRLAHEAELVARGRSDIAAGHVVSGEAVEAWVSESLRLGRPTERPRSKPRSASRAG